MKPKIYKNWNIKISELKYDNDGTPYRIVAGQRDIQSQDENLNKIANEIRIAGMTPSEYLRNCVEIKNN